MLQGKGFYIWKIKECENGDIEKIAEKAADGNFSHVIVKIADGPITMIGIVILTSSRCWQASFIAGALRFGGGISFMGLNPPGKRKRLFNGSMN